MFHIVSLANDFLLVDTLSTALLNDFKKGVLLPIFKIMEGLAKLPKRPIVWLQGNLGKILFWQQGNYLFFLFFSIQDQTFSRFLLSDHTTYFITNLRYVQSHHIFHPGDARKTTGLLWLKNWTTPRFCHPNVLRYISSSFIANCTFVPALPIFIIVLNGTWLGCHFLSVFVSLIRILLNNFFLINVSMRIKFCLPIRLKESRF